MCPVCGFDDLEVPAYDPTTGLGTYEICPCCGYEFGVTDEDLEISHEEWRQRWIDSGMQWIHDSKPANWDPVAQLKRVQAPDA